ncbi:MAG: amidophosphoribosyltransferase, partial [Kiritimatiellae bacterium]|nr:amidophosphoribosyltransferase [Kiritimatiellia bacterium]
MSDELKHECAVAMVVFRKPPSAMGDFGGTKLSLLLEKQHNRGQDGAGAAILHAHPVPGEESYWISKSASSTPLVDVLGAIARRNGAAFERIFLGHLRYATFGKNDTAFCHPFVHESSELAHTLFLAGNFNLTNAAELFERYRSMGEFPTSRADGYF